MSKTISDELFTDLISYHLYGNRTQETEERIKSLLSQKVTDIASRNKYRQDHGFNRKD